MMAGNFVNVNQYFAEFPTKDPNNDNASRPTSGSYAEELERLQQRKDGKKKAKQMEKAVPAVLLPKVDAQTISELSREQHRKIFGPDPLDMQKTPKEKYDHYVMPKLRTLENDAAKATERNDHSRAIVLWEKMMKLGASKEATLTKVAKSYTKMADFSASIRSYKELCKISPEKKGYPEELSLVYALQGQSFFNSGLYEDALESFTKAAELRPVNEFHTKCIACLSAIGRHGECLAMVNKRLEKEQSNPDLFVMKARLHLLFNHTSLAYFACREALKLDPTHPEAKDTLTSLQEKAEHMRQQAIFLQLRGLLKEATGKLSDAIDTNPEVADYHVLRGALYRRLGDFNSAVDDFLIAVDKCEHDEDSPIWIDATKQLEITLNDFAIKCYSNGHHDEAILLLNRAIQSDNAEKGFYINRGDCFVKKNEINFALLDYEQALELDPDDNNIKEHIAAIYEKQGNTALEKKEYGSAEEKLSDAIGFSPVLNSKLYFSRARARFMSGDVFGSQNDVITCLHLDAAMEEAMTLANRLFPNRTISDIINSPAGLSIKMALHQQNKGVLKTLSVPSRRPQRKTLNSMTFRMKSSSTVDHRTDSTEKATQQMLASQKADAEIKVKSALQNRKTFRVKATKLTSLPANLDIGSRGIITQQGIELLGSHQKKGWKQFGKGISF